MKNRHDQQERDIEMKRHLAVVLLVAVFWASTSSVGPASTWTDRLGRQFEGEFVSLVDGIVGIDLEFPAQERESQTTKIAPLLPTFVKAAPLDEKSNPQKEGQSEMEEFKPGALGTRTVIGEEGNSYRIYPGSFMQVEGNQPQIDYPGTVLLIAEGGVTIQGRKLAEGTIYHFNDKREPQLTKEGEYSVWISCSRNTSIFREKNGKGQRLAEVKAGEKLQLLFASQAVNGWHRVRAMDQRKAEGWIKAESWDQTFFMKRKAPNASSERAESSVKPTRLWSDRTGRQFTGDFISFDDGLVRIKRQGGDRVFSVPLEKLSDADQAFVRSQAKTKPVVEPKPTKYTVWVFKLTGSEWVKDEGRTWGTTDAKKAEEYMAKVKSTPGWTATSNVPKREQPAKGVAGKSLPPKSSSRPPQSRDGLPAIPSVDRTKAAKGPAAKPDAKAVAKWQTAKAMLLVITIHRKNVTLDAEAKGLPKHKGKYGPIAHGRVEAMMQGLPLSSVKTIAPEEAGDEKDFRLKLYILRDAAQHWPAQNGNDTTLASVNLWGLDGFEQNAVLSKLLESSFLGGYDVLLSGDMDSSGAIKGQANGWVLGAKRMPFLNADFIISPLQLDSKRKYVLPPEARDSADDWDGK